MATTLTYSHNNQTIVIQIRSIDNAPSQLFWVDEYKWTPVIQSQEYSISGALIVEEWVKQAGRPITLTGGDDRVWVSKNTVAEIQTLLELPGKTITLQLGDGRTFQVIFDNSNGPAFESEPLWSLFPSPINNPYIIKSLKFIMV